MPNVYLLVSNKKVKPRERNVYVSASPLSDGQRFSRARNIKASHVSDGLRRNAVSTLIATENIGSDAAENWHKFCTPDMITNRAE